MAKKLYSMLKNSWVNFLQTEQIMEIRHISRFLMTTISMQLIKMVQQHP